MNREQLTAVIMASFIRTNVVPVGEAYGLADIAVQHMLNAGWPGNLSGQHVIHHPDTLKQIGVRV